MSDNPQPDTIDKDITLRLRYLQLRFPDREEGEDNGSIKSTLCDSKTSGHDSYDVQTDAGLSDECFSGSEDEDADSYLGQDPEELNEIISNVDNESTAQSDDRLIFSGTEVERIGECFKDVIYKCDAGSSSGECSSRAGDVLHRSIEMATQMAKGDEVQQAVLKLASSDSSFMRHVDELGEDIDALKTPIKLSRKRRSRLRRHRSGNEKDLVKDPWYIRFVDAFFHLCKQVGRLGAQAVNLIINKIMACFNVARAIAQNIFKAIQRSLLWIKRSIVDPQGEIKRILHDPEKSNPAKALGVIGVVATAIVGALLLACGIAEVGPYGVGAAAIGAAASAILRRQPSQDNEESLIQKK